MKWYLHHPNHQRTKQPHLPLPDYREAHHPKKVPCGAHTWICDQPRGRSEYHRCANWWRPHLWGPIPKTPQQLRYRQTHIGQFQYRSGWWGEFRTHGKNVNRHRHHNPRSGNERNMHRNPISGRTKHLNPRSGIFRCRCRLGFRFRHQNPRS